MRTQPQALYTQYTNNNVVATEFSRRRKPESAYKRTRQSRQVVVRIQSALCEVACEQNNHGLNIAVVKFYPTAICA